MNNAVKTLTDVIASRSVEQTAEFNGTLTYGDTDPVDVYTIKLKSLFLVLKRLSSYGFTYAYLPGRPRLILKSCLKPCIRGTLEHQTRIGLLNC